MPKKKPRRKTTVKVSRGGGVAKPKPAKTRKPKTNEPKRKRGRPRQFTPEELKQRQRESQLNYHRKAATAARDIQGEEWTELTNTINWERRLACKRDLRLFDETYLRNIFYMPWSDDQLRCIRKAEAVILDDGQFSLAMPRGGGKTANVRGAITWATAYAHRRFPFNIGSTDPKSLQTLEAIKTFWYSSPLLLQDFPEIAWAIRQTENRFHRTRGQTFYGHNTYIEWGSSSVRFPCLLLPPEEAERFLKPRVNGKLKSLKDEDLSIYQLREYPDRWIPRQAGINIATAGIGGSIRGEAETHPITLEQPRPDVVILDDIQKDQTAESPTQVEKLVNLIDGAIVGLAGPGGHIAALMPCTVTRVGDVSDTYLDPEKKPEWRGERCKLVSAWPDGITDTQITLETSAGKRWNEYLEIRRDSYRDFDLHTRDCEHCRDNMVDPCSTGKAIQFAPTQYYLDHRGVMDDGFEVTWDERYGNPVLQPNGSIVRKDWREISAQQHAMNLRAKAPLTFPAEYQNEGRDADEGEILITPVQLMRKIVDIPQDHLPPDAQFVVAQIDVQNEILFYTVFATDPDFNGVFTRRGTFPEIRTRWFTKAQTEGWSHLTRLFFEAYPQHKAKATKNKAGRYRAPLEAKIYHALGLCVNFLRGLTFTRLDEHRKAFRLQRIGIDTRWGQTSECTKRFIRESGIPELVPYYGQDYPPTRRQLEEFERRKGWLFESQVNPEVKEDKWVVRPNPDGMFYMAADVDRLKDFLFARLATPLGAPGSVALHAGGSDHWEMFANHVAGSEYPEPVTSRGMTKNKYVARQGFDNDWLDCSAACMALASMLGASLKTSAEPIRIIRRKLSDHRKAKRGRG